MRIAAILSLPGQQQGAEKVAPDDAYRPAAEASYASLEILGKTLKERLLSKVDAFGIEAPTIIAGDCNDTLVPPRAARSDVFVEAWENAIANYVNQGIESLLLVRSTAYCDLDYEVLLRFHLESGSPITQAYAPDGALDVAIVNVSLLRGADSSYRQALSALIPKQRRYLYRGYVNRLVYPADFYQLVDDALHGVCQLQPDGEETRENVWQGLDSEIDNSAVVNGPAFIGRGSRVAACCAIGAGTAIERNCEIDCGTVVHQSWITENTYLGVALDFRHSLVNGKQLFKLDRNIAMSIDDDHLIAPALKSLPFLASWGNKLRRPERTA